MITHTNACRVARTKILEGVFRVSCGGPHAIYYMKKGTPPLPLRCYQPGLTTALTAHMLRRSLLSVQTEEPQRNKRSTREFPVLLSARLRLQLV